MRRINSILCHLLHMHIDIPAINIEFGPIGMLRLCLGDGFWLKGRRYFIRVVPDQNCLVDLAHRPTGDHLLSLGNPGRQILGVRNVRALTLAIVTPTMKRALNRLTHHSRTTASLIANAIAQMRAHMWAIGI